MQIGKLYKPVLVLYQDYLKAGTAKSVETYWTGICFSSKNRIWNT